MTLSALGVLADVPVDPDSGEARDWILGELAKPEYRAAQPTWFDRLASGFRDWLDSLTLRADGVSQGPLLLFLLIIVIAAVVAAILIFGLPRLNRRSASGVLFGEDDQRDAAAMRRAAEEAARAGQWAAAIQERFRALAKDLAERTILTTSPGTTARGVAERAGTVFPARAARLLNSADLFDGVRYLGDEGSEAGYREVAALETELRSARLEQPV